MEKKAMIEMQSKKNFLSTKDMREAHTDWLMGHEWSLDYRWHNHDHAACSAYPGGKWTLQGYGHYLASDWHWRLYQSHRCTKCGFLVQHNQSCDENGVGVGIISRLVIVK